MGSSILVKYLIVFLVSMLPIIELRGAIPIAESMGLDILWYYPISIIGNILPVPIIYLFARKVLEWGKDKKFIGNFFTWCLEKGDKGGKKLKESAGNNGIFLALLVFVGIPLPGTGAVLSRTDYCLQNQSQRSPENSPLSAFESPLFLNHHRQRLQIP